MCISVMTQSSHSSSNVHTFFSERLTFAVMVGVILVHMKGVRTYTVHELRYGPLQVSPSFCPLEGAAEQILVERPEVPELSLRPRCSNRACWLQMHLDSFRTLFPC